MSTQHVTITLPLPGSRARWIALGLGAGLVAASIASPALSPRQILAADPGTTPEHTISVSGTGRVVLSPDTAELRLGVTTSGKTVAVVRAAAAKSMTAVLASLRAAGIADRDVQTTILSLQPAYDYSTGTNPPRLTGYTLSNAVAVTVRDLDNVGDAIDGALAAGATSLDGITFRVQDQTAAEKQAREAAVSEAKSKATVLAAAAGVSIGGVQSISETVASIPYPVYYGAMAAPGAKDVATPVSPGSNEITVSVAVVYLIG